MNEEPKTAKLGVNAETLFKEFREVQLSEFFRKNRQYLGYVGKQKSLTTVVHELVTNSLDACEEAGILPDIKVIIKELGNEHYKVIVEDNGPGVPEKHIDRVFGQLLTGTKFHRNIQLRGQQGLGVSGAVLFSQITTGKPTRIRSGTGNGKVVDAQILIDIKTNSPKIVEKEVYNDMWRGTIVESEFKGVKYSRGAKGPFEYMRWTAAANPHAQIFFKDNTSEILFERVVNQVPPRPKEIKPHPEGLEPHDLLDIAHSSKARQVSSMLMSELSRVSADKVREIQEVVNTDIIQNTLKELLPEQKISEIIKKSNLKSQAIKEDVERAVREVLVGEDQQKISDIIRVLNGAIFDMRMSPKRLEWEQAEQLVNAFKKVKFMAPPTSGLIPIGKKVIEKALTNLLAPDFVEAISRSPSVYRGGIPFLVEVAIAYGGNSGRETSEGGRKVELMRFANRAPLLFDAGGCVTTLAMESIDWKRYHIIDLESAPITIFINLISTHVPYTSAGKQAIAKEDEIYDEIRFALMQIARTLQKFLAGKRRVQEEKAKKRMFEKYVPETATALSKLTGMDANEIQKSLEKIVMSRFSELFSKEELQENTQEEGAAYEEIPEPDEEAEE